MNDCLEKLAAVVEQEIAVGEELQGNLIMQRQALIDWNVAALLDAIAAREPWLRQLEDLERQRGECLQQPELAQGVNTLRQLIALLPPKSPDVTRMSALQERARKVFFRLQALEKDLHGVMAHMLAHIQEALGGLNQPVVSLYSESGVSGSPATASALLQSRV